MKFLTYGSAAALAVLLIHGMGYGGEHIPVCHPGAGGRLPHHFKDAVGLLRTGGGFAAPLWPHDECGVKGFQLEGKLLVNDASKCALGLCPFTPSA